MTSLDGTTPDFDVVVVGAGPAGSSAAGAAARAGARTLVIDRATFPRYKTCGGGLIGASLASLPAGVRIPIKQEVFAATFTLRGRRPRTRHDNRQILALTDRADFDQALVEAARQDGADVLFGTTVTRASPDAHGVTLATGAGELRARYVIAADGSASRLGRQVGVRLETVDLGLEHELEVAGTTGNDWAGRIHLDWGTEPGSYAWVFPKGKTLTVGVIMTKGKPQETRRYLEQFTRLVGLDDASVVRSSGHLTRCRTADSPLGRGRVLVCGDAAGLLEPWTREGISFALRSGRLAGTIAGTAVGPDASPGSTLTAYEAAVRRTLTPEMAAGRKLLRAFERHPGVFHTLLIAGRPGWREFAEMARGSTDFAAALGHPAARYAVGLLQRF